MSAPLKTAAIVAAVSFVTLLVLAAALLAVEGYPAMASVVREWSAPRPSAERLHTGFDPDLGWINLPNLRLKDLYAPGASLSTNARGFRGLRETSDRPSPRKFRVICSGDSFTLGYGVDDAETWPAALERLEPRVDTVNLGLGGYGVDQSYLRFRRDAAPLQHDLHVLAFIYADFERMKSRQFFGYSKPHLSVEHGRLRVEPPLVSDGEPGPPSRLSRMLVALHRLETVRFFESFARRHVLSADDAEVRAVALAIFEELDRESRRRGGRFVAVYLPTLMDEDPTRLDGLRAFLTRELGNRGIPFIDLTTEFRRLPGKRLESLFIDGRDSKFLGADGHYTPAGNRLVARLLRDRLPLPKKRPA